jgi:hypothetical protein
MLRREGVKPYANLGKILENPFCHPIDHPQPVALWVLEPPTTPLAHLSSSMASSNSLSLWFALGCHRHGHFSRQAPLLEPPCHWPPLTLLEPYRASLLLFHVPITLSRSCPSRQNFVKHLAGAKSTSPRWSNRPPPRLISRQGPCLSCPASLAQPHLLPLSFCVCPKRRPLWPVSIERAALCLARACPLPPPPI